MSAVDGLVEKVARAIYATRPDGCTKWVRTGTSGSEALDRTQTFIPDTWEESGQQAREQCTIEAIAALSTIDQHREEAVLEAIDDYLAMTGAVLTHRSLSGPSDDDLRVGLAEHIADAIVGQRKG